MQQDTVRQRSIGQKHILCNVVFVQGLGKENTHHSIQLLKEYSLGGIIVTVHNQETDDLQQVPNHY